MIQKRFQKYTKDGVVWTDWFDTSLEGDEETVKQLNRSQETKWQLKNKLLNEFRHVTVFEVPTGEELKRQIASFKQFDYRIRITH